MLIYIAKSDDLQSLAMMQRMLLMTGGNNGEF